VCVCVYTHTYVYIIHIHIYQKCTCIQPQARNAIPRLGACGAQKSDLDGEGVKNPV